MGRRRTECEDFGVRCGIVPENPFVVPPSDDLSLGDKDGPDRNLCGAERPFGLFQRLGHPSPVHVLKLGRKFRRHEARLQDALIA